MQTQQKLVKKVFQALVFSLCVFGVATQAHADDPSPRICDVKSYGAKGDGATKDTVAIQAAIDSCAKTGGVVDLHDGTYFTGMITLKSNITLRVEATATIKGTQDDADYPDTNPPTDNSQLLNCRKTLIYAQSATNLTIEGGGTIDGNGNKPSWTGSAKERTRPMAIYIALSNHVTIQNIKVRQAAMWGVVNLETDNLTIRNIDIHSDLGGTRDGIDIVDCHHVLVESATVFSEDDAICLKSGTARGVEDVIVRNSHVLQSSVANGLKLGTASTGSFKNVLFQNIVVENVDKAAMAVESVDGADIDGITFQNIHFRHSGNAVFIILGKRGTPKKIGSIQNITFDNVTGTQMKHTWGSAISGTIIDGVTYAPENIIFNNVHISSLGGLTSVPSTPPEYDGRYPDPNLWGNLPASGYFIRHVNDLYFTNSTMDIQPTDVRQVMVEEDVTHIEE